MRKNALQILALTLTCFLLSAFPAFAGEWKEIEEDRWQYIDDDGEPVTGWLELEDSRYYFDENGVRKQDCWLKDDGYWYYLQEDGVMAANTWVDNYYVDETGRFEKKR